jgi:hypothetical protein
MNHLLKNGLVVFEYFHNFKLHSEEKDQSNSFKDFMSLFVSILNPLNFINIIEINIEFLFKYMLKYEKECFEICL